MRPICRKKFETNFMFNKFFPLKSCRLLDNVEKYCRAGQARTDNKIWRMCFYVGFLRLQTHGEDIKYLWLFDGNNGYSNAPQCYVDTYTARLVNIILVKYSKIKFHGNPSGGSRVVPR
jgi:hypothetical protein